MPEDFQDLKCRDCGTIFSCPEGEAAFFRERGWPPPVRCLECRRASKARREEVQP
jgi:primosomal protein N'